MALAGGILEITTFLPMYKRDAEEERPEVWRVVPQADENSPDSQTVGPEAYKESI